MTRYGMAIDMGRCVGCQTCSVSCQLEAALRPGGSRIRVDALEWGRWPDADRAYLPRACIHCDDPLCVNVCPTGASTKRDDGIVVVNPELCIGCGVCVTACEYGARSINTRDAHHFDAEAPAPYEAEGMQLVGVADKCDFCAARLADGLRPACVRDCVLGVRAFGDLDDPGSEVNAFIANCGCEAVPGSALYYARGGRELDVKGLIARGHVSAKEDRLRQEPSGTSPNPTVRAAAGIAAAGIAAGLGTSAKRSRAKRRRVDYEVRL